MRKILFTLLKISLLNILVLNSEAKYLLDYSGYQQSQSVSDVKSARSEQVQLVLQTKSCRQFYLKRFNVSYKEAVKICSQGVSMDCIEKVYPSAEYNYMIAAGICKGHVDLDCLDNSYHENQLDILLTAKNCRDDQSHSCVNFLKNEIALSPINAEIFCRVHDN